MEEEFHFPLPQLVPEALSSILDFLYLTDIANLLLSGDLYLRRKIHRSHIWKTLKLELRSEKLSNYWLRWSQSSLFVPSTLERLHIRCIWYGPQARFFDWKISILPKTLREFDFEAMYSICAFITYNMGNLGFVKDGAFFVFPKKQDVMNMIAKHGSNKNRFFLRLSDHLPYLEHLNVLDYQLDVMKGLSKPDIRRLEAEFCDGIGSALRSFYCSWSERFEFFPPQITDTLTNCAHWKDIFEQEWPFKPEKLQVALNRHLPSTGSDLFMKLNLGHLKSLQIDTTRFHQLHMPLLTCLKIMNPFGEPDHESLLKYLSSSFPLLKELYIQFLSSSDLLEFLPQTLTKFGLSVFEVRTKVLVKHVQRLPRSIIHLSMTPSVHFEDGLLQQLPPNLTSLQFTHLVCTDEQVMTLPKSVTKLVIGTVVITGALLDETAPVVLSPLLVRLDSLERLHSSFNLTCRYRVGDFDFKILKLPASTTRTVDLDLSMIPPKDLPPALMRLPASYLSKRSRLEHVPRSLTRINFSPNIKASWSSMKSLPTCLRILKGGTITFQLDHEIHEVLDALTRESTTLEVPTSFSDFAHDYFNQRYKRHSENDEYVTDFGLSFRDEQEEERDGRKFRNPVPKGIHCLLRPRKWYVNLQPRHIKYFSQLLEQSHGSYPSTIKLHYFKPIMPSKPSKHSKNTPIMSETHEKSSVEVLNIEWPSSMTCLGIPVKWTTLVPRTGLRHLNIYLNLNRQMNSEGIIIEPHLEQFQFPSSLERLNIYGSIVTSSMLLNMSQLTRLESLSLSSCQERPLGPIFPNHNHSPWNALPPSLKSITLGRIIHTKD